MRFALALVPLAACFSDGTGTVAYSEFGTGHVMIVDVATATQTAIDYGVYGSVSIAPDGKHVAYVGADFAPKVADLAGNVVALSPPTGGCQTTLTWGSTGWLQYCIEDALGFGIGFLPAPGQPARRLMSNLLAVTHDGTRLVYLLNSQPMMGSLFGDLVVENADGSGRRVLRSQTNVLSIAISPDDTRAVALLDDTQFELDAITLADGATHTIAVVDAIPGPIPNASLFSPSGAEILAIKASQLVALDLETGAARHLATLDQQTFGMGAGFLDENRVISTRQQSFSMPGGGMGGDVPAVPSPASIHITDGTNDIALAPSDGSSQCVVTDVALDAGLAAISCAVPAVIDFSGRVVTARNSSLSLGLSADRKGIVTVNQQGAIEYDALDGNVKILATAMSPNSSSGTGGLVGPFAAYAP